jgi:hypothetical protein
VIYSSACDITATANDLAGEGHPVDPLDLATITPYNTHTVRRFGDWHLDLTPPETAAPTHLAIPGMTCRPGLEDSSPSHDPGMSSMERG